MAVISTAMYEALLLAHVPEEKARAAAAEVAESQNFISKSDLFEFGEQLRSEMDRRFGDIDKRFGDIDKRFGSMDRRFVEVEKSLAVLKFAVFSGGSIGLALLLKLVFFP